MCWSWLLLMPARALARGPWSERYPRARGAVRRVAAQACHRKKEAADQPIPVSHARSNTTCYGYDHAIDGRRRFSIDKDTLELVNGRRQCNLHWQAINKLKKVRASSRNGGHARC